MREIMHFSSTKERIKYLSGGFEEIVPVEAKPKKVENEQMKAENDEKPPKKASKSKKKAKKGKEDGKVQAE